MNPNDILSLLMGNNLPVDPRATAMLQQFNAGNLPGHPVSNWNTILDLLSPSASMDYMEQRGGPQALETAFGIGPDQSSQVIEQMLGLRLSPMQMQTGQTEIMKLFPELQKAQASLGQAAAAQTSADAATRQAGVAEREAGVKEATEARLKEQWEKGTPQDRAALFEMNLKSIALTGTMIDGTQVPKDVRQNAYALLKGFSSMPGVTALISEMAKEGEWEAAGRLVGLPAGALKDTWLSGLVVSDEAAGAASQPFGLNLGGSSDMDQEALNQQIQKMQESFQQNFWQLLEKAKQ